MRSLAHDTETPTDLERDRQFLLDKQNGAPRAARSMSISPNCETTPGARLRQLAHMVGICLTT